MNSSLWSRLTRMWRPGDRTRSHEIRSRPRAVLENVEARLLYSADLAPGLADAGPPAWEAQDETTVSTQALAGQLVFERNEGQADESVDFLARGAGYSAALSGGDATINLLGTGQWTTLRLHLDASQAATNATGEDLLSSRSNYLVGSQEDWLTGIANFAAVRYDGVYEGIDVRYYGNPGRLEYDFIVQPDADAGQIALAFDGARSLAIAHNGDLVITLNETGDSIRFQAPVSYQIGANGREAVDSRYVIRDDGKVGFVLGGYDKARALVIDPTLDYGSYLGGSGTDSIRDVAMDATGNVYATGTTTSSASFATSGDTTFSGSTDAFVARYASDGSLSWVTYYGGDGNDIGYGMGLDASGNVYIAGQTDSTDLATPNGAVTARGTGSAGFMARIDSTGSSVTYGTYSADVGDADAYYDVAVGNSGVAYVTGGLGNAGSHQLVVARYDTSVSGAASLTAARTDYASAADTWGRGIALDSAGRVHVVGTTSAAFTSALPSNTWQSTYGGSSDAFLARLSASSLTWDYVTYMGGAGAEEGQSIAVDASDKTVVAGVARSGGMASSGAYDAVFDSSAEAFIAKFDTSVSGSASRIFTTYYGSEAGQDTMAYSVGVLPGGSIIATGSTTSSMLPTSADALDATPGGGTDGFVAVFNATGTSLTYGAYVGGTGTDVAYAVASNGKTVLIAGETASDSMATSDGADTTRSGTDGFIQKYTFNTAPTVVPQAITTLAGQTGLYVFEQGSGPASSLVAGGSSLNVQAPIEYSSSAGRVAGSTGLLFTADANSSTHPVSLATVPNVVSTQAFSFAAWLRFDALSTTGGWERVFDFGAGPVNNNIYVTRDGTSNSLAVGTFSGSSWAGGFAMSNALTGQLGQWIHLALTLDSNRELTVYLNGAATGVITLTSMPDFSTWTRNYIGSSNWSDNRQFRGAMDDIALFDRALTRAEVASMARAPAASATIPENSPVGTMVFRAISHDPDPSDVQVYSLTDDAGGRFAIDPSTGVVTVADDTLLDYESTPVSSIVVRATDSDGAFDEQTFTIALTNVNEPIGSTSDADSTPNSVPENAANGAAVGITAFASDPDNGITYSLSDSAGGRFQIDASTGVVTVANSALLDYETQTTHSITAVSTSQDGSTSSSASFTISVAAANDNTPVVTSGASASVAENAAAATTVTATDADLPGQTLTYSIVGGADAASFTIDPATGALSFVAAPDFENPNDADADNVYELTVQASDGSLATTQAITVAVTDMDDSPVVTSDAGVFVTTGPESSNPIPRFDQTRSAASVQQPTVTGNGTIGSQDSNTQPGSVVASAAGALFNQPALQVAGKAEVVSQGMHTDCTTTGAGRRHVLYEVAAIKALWMHLDQADDGTMRQLLNASDAGTSLRVVFADEGASQHTQEEQLMGNVLREHAMPLTLAALSVGATLWTSRSLGLLASLAASLSAWKTFDVLPVLKQRDDKSERAVSPGADVSAPDAPLPARHAAAMRLEIGE